MWLFILKKDLVRVLLPVNHVCAYNKVLCRFGDVINLYVPHVINIPKKSVSCAFACESCMCLIQVFLGDLSDKPVCASYAGLFLK